MTVENPSVVDEVTQNDDGTEFILGMYETRPLDGNETQLQELLTKVNFYADVIETGMFVERFPQARNARLSVLLTCLDEPSDPKIIELLGAAARLFSAKNVEFFVQVIPRELFEPDGVH